MLLLRHYYYYDYYYYYYYYSTLLYSRAKMSRKKSISTCTTKTRDKVTCNSLKTLVSRVRAAHRPLLNALKNH